jgi:hypothetical protein
MSNRCKAVRHLSVAASRIDKTREETIMEYAILIYRDESKDGELDWPTIEADYERYFKEAGEAGVYRGGPRLQQSALTTTVAVRDGRRLVTDGPFIEAREQLGGIFVIECADLDEAIEWAGRCPGAAHGTVEVRPVWPS